MEHLSTALWALSVLVGICGGVVAAFKAISEHKAGRQLRERELRFQQANAGKKLLEELFQDEEARRALLMLDFRRQNFIGESKERIQVNSQEIPEVMKNAFAKEDAKTVLVVKSFDALFYLLNLFEHFINVGLTRQEDVAVPVNYYAKLLAKNKTVYVDYIANGPYEKALEFLNRFPEWRDGPR